MNQYQDNQTRVFQHSHRPPSSDHLRFHRSGLGGSERMGVVLSACIPRPQIKASLTEGEAYSTSIPSFEDDVTQVDLEKGWEEVSEGDLKIRAWYWSLFKWRRK